MISVEFLERQAWCERRAPAAKIIFHGKHFLRANDVMHLFNWTLDDVIPERINRTEVYFVHWLGAGAIYQYDPLAHLLPRKKTASLVLVPLGAWVPVESWLMEVADYVSAKHPDAKIYLLDIQGQELLRSRAHQLYPNRR